MIYNDRKMMKWQGFILSEHHDKLTDVAKPDDLIELPEQSETFISEMLADSFQSGKEIFIQLNERDIKGHFKQLTGKILGSENQLILLETTEKETISIEQTQIRHIQKPTFKKWYES